MTRKDRLIDLTWAPCPLLQYGKRESGEWQPHQSHMEWATPEADQESAGSLMSAGKKKNKNKKITFPKKAWSLGGFIFQLKRKITEVHPEARSRATAAMV